MHQFDAYDDGNDDNFLPWDRCTWGGCYEHSGRMSASLIARYTEPFSSDRPISIYSTTHAGFVYSPTNNRLLCSFPYDAGVCTQALEPRHRRMLGRTHSLTDVGVARIGQTAERDCPNGQVDPTRDCIPGCTPKNGAWGWWAGDDWWCEQTRGFPCAWSPAFLWASLEIHERIRNDPINVSCIPLMGLCPCGTDLSARCDRCDGRHGRGRY